MRLAVRRVTGVLVLLSSLSCASSAPPLTTASHWYRGNTHAHTLWDNGDALPELVATWYRSHGYQFVVLSDHDDHNSLTGAERWVEVPDLGTLGSLEHELGAGWSDISTREGRPRLRLKTSDELRQALDDPGRFLLLPGQEIGDSFQGRMVHHVVLNSQRIIPPPGGSSVGDVLQRTIAAVEGEATRNAAPALVHLSHPNLGWAVSAKDLGPVSGERFFEVYNGHPLAHNQGEGDHQSTEELWDQVLSDRLRSGSESLLYGLAVDDAHHYRGQGPAHPGRGWIMVRAPELSAEAILGAMSRGDFYSSTGVTLEELHAGECHLSVKVVPEPGATYTIRFVGAWAGKPGVGLVLQESKGTEGTYYFDGDELYVRVVVISDRLHPDAGREGVHQMAWGQPVRVGWTQHR